MASSGYRGTSIGALDCRSLTFHTVAYVPGIFFNTRDIAVDLSHHSLYVLYQGTVLRLRMTCQTVSHYEPGSRRPEDSLFGCMP
jgi:hypothetical protein